MTEVRGQKSDVGSQRTENGKQKAEVLDYKIGISDLEDISPTGASKGVMMLQGLSGQILVAFFIVALYKKLMSR